MLGGALLLHTPLAWAESIIFGEPPVTREEPVVMPETHWVERVSVDPVRAELGFPAGTGAVSGVHTLQAQASALFPVGDNWGARLEGRLDSTWQTGDENVERTELDYGEIYLSYRGAARRVTLGTQKVTWGRVDELPPTDRLSVQDVTRLVLDDMEDRRRAVPALRWEEFWGDYKLDALYVPWFRSAELPKEGSFWHPVDRERGRIMGVPGNPAMAALIREGRFDEDAGGAGGWGLRLSRAGRGHDYAVTIQRARHSLPYYVLDTRVREALLTNPVDLQAALGASPYAFETEHPRTWVLGGDLGVAIGRSTWRFEAAWLSDQPVTTEVLDYTQVEALEWVGGVEFFPGDADLRVNLQLGGNHLLDAPETLLEDRNTYTFFGDAEQLFGRGRWEARIRFFLGLHERDVYLNPRLAYLGHEPHEWYVGYHYFEGAEGTLGGFHEHHDLFTAGLLARF
jgi:hypothetical protein